MKPAAVNLPNFSSACQNKDPKYDFKHKLRLVCILPILFFILFNWLCDGNKQQHCGLRQELMQELHFWCK